jgi:hypothetical protein
MGKFKVMLERVETIIKQDAVMVEEERQRQQGGPSLPIWRWIKAPITMSWSQLRVELGTWW